MRKFLLIGIVYFMIASSAFAADSPKVELFGGYSFFGENNNNLNGWTGSATYNINSWLGVEGQASGRYQSQDVRVLGNNFELDRVRHCPCVAFVAAQTTTMTTVIGRGSGRSVRGCY